MSDVLDRKPNIIAFRNHTPRCSHGFAIGVVKCPECSGEAQRERARLKQGGKHLAGALIIEDEYGEDTLILLCPNCAELKRLNRSWIYKLNNLGKAWVCSDCNRALRRKSKSGK